MGEQFGLFSPDALGSADAERHHRRINRSGKNLEARVTNDTTEHSTADETVLTDLHHGDDHDGDAHVDPKLYEPWKGDKKPDVPRSWIVKDSKTKH